MDEKIEKIVNETENILEENPNAFLKSDISKKIKENVKNESIDHIKKFELIRPILEYESNIPENKSNMSLSSKKMWGFLEDKLEIKTDLFFKIKEINEFDCIWAFTKREEEDKTLPLIYPMKKIKNKDELEKGKIELKNGEIKKKYSKENLEKSLRQIVNEVRKERFPEIEIPKKIPVTFELMEGRSGNWSRPLPIESNEYPLGEISINIDIMDREEDFSWGVKKATLKSTLTHEFSHAFIGLKEEKYELYKGLGPSEWTIPTEVLASLVTILKGGLQDFRKIKSNQLDFFEPSFKDFSYYSKTFELSSTEEILLKEDGIEEAMNLESKGTGRISLLSIMERDWEILTRGWSYSEPLKPITKEEDIWEMLVENYKDTYLWKYFGAITESERKKYLQKLNQDEKIMEKKKKLEDQIWNKKWGSLYDYIFRLDYDKYQKYLQEGEVSKKLKMGFEENNSKLPEGATLSSKKLGKKSGWTVKDQENKEKFWIEEVEERELKIYSKEKWKNLDDIVNNRLIRIDN